MNITLKLFASLTDHLPAASKYTNLVELDVAEGATIGDVIAPYKLPERLVHLVLVNGTYIQPEDRPTRALRAGDVLAIWPPVAGG